MATHYIKIILTPESLEVSEHLDKDNTVVTRTATENKKE